MNFREFESKIINLPIFNLNDVRKIDPGFHRQQLIYWRNQGYIKPLAGGYYMLANMNVSEPFLFSKTKPDLAFLEKKMGIGNPEKLRNDFLERIADFNFKALAEDVAPFVIKQDQVNRVLKFKEFWSQIELI